MFGNKKLKAEIENLRWYVDRDSKRYWELKEEHIRLLNALSLVEKTTSPKKEYVKIEKSESNTAI